MSPTRLDVLPDDVLTEIFRMAHNISFVETVKSINEYAWFKADKHEFELEYDWENFNESTDYERLPRYYLTNKIIDDKIHPPKYDSEDEDDEDDESWDDIMKRDFEHRTNHLERNQLGERKYSFVFFRGKKYLTVYGSSEAENIARLQKKYDDWLEICEANHVSNL